MFTSSLLGGQAGCGFIKAFHSKELLPAASGNVFDEGLCAGKSKQRNKKKMKRFIEPRGGRAVITVCGFAAFIEILISSTLA